VRVAQCAFWTRRSPCSLGGFLWCASEGASASSVYFYYLPLCLHGQVRPAMWAIDHLFAETAFCIWTRRTLRQNFGACRLLDLINHQSGPIILHWGSVSSTRVAQPIQVSEVCAALAPFSHRDRQTCHHLSRALHKFKRRPQGRIFSKCALVAALMVDNCLASCCRAIQDSANKTKGSCSTCPLGTGSAKRQYFVLDRCAR